MNNYAYATLVTKSSYIPCVLRQIQRMKHLKCKYPFLILIDRNLDDLDKAILKTNSSYVCECLIDKFSYSDKRFSDTLSKFKFLDFLEYDKILFLDADTLLVKNLDFIFDQIDFEEECYIKTLSDIDTINEENLELKNICNVVLMFKPCENEYQRMLNINENFSNSRHYKTHDEDFLLKNIKNITHKNLTNKTMGDKILHFTGPVHLYNLSNVFPVIDFLFNQVDENTFNKIIDEHSSTIGEITNTYLDFEVQISNLENSIREITNFILAIKDVKIYKDLLTETKENET